mgnify:CR=1 FL=1
MLYLFTESFEWRYVGSTNKIEFGIELLFEEGPISLINLKPPNEESF